MCGLHECFATEYSSEGAAGSKSTAAPLCIRGQPRTYSVHRIGCEPMSQILWGSEKTDYGGREVPDGNRASIAMGR